MNEFFFSPVTAIVLVLVALTAVVCAIVADEVQPATHKSRNWFIVAFLAWFAAVDAQPSTALIASAVVMLCVFAVAPVIVHQLRYPRSKEAATNPVFIDEDGRIGL